MRGVGYCVSARWDAFAARRLGRLGRAGRRAEARRFHGGERHLSGTNSSGKIGSIDRGCGWHIVRCRWIYWGPAVWGPRFNDCGRRSYFWEKPNEKL